MRLVDEYTDDLVTAVGGGTDLGDAMRDLTLKHAERLRDLGPVAVLAFDLCPRCGGRVIAGDTEAICAAGCEWRHSLHGGSA